MWSRTLLDIDLHKIQGEFDMFPPQICFECLIIDTDRILFDNIIMNIQIYIQSFWEYSSLRISCMVGVKRHLPAHIHEYFNEKCLAGY